MSQNMRKFSLSNPKMAEISRLNFVRLFSKFQLSNLRKKVLEIPEIEEWVAKRPVTQV